MAKYWTPKQYTTTLEYDKKYWIGQKNNQWSYDTINHKSKVRVWTSDLKYQESNVPFYISDPIDSIFKNGQVYIYPNNLDEAWRVSSTDSYDNGEKYQRINIKTAGRTAYTLDDKLKNSIFFQNIFYVDEFLALSDVVSRNIGKEITFSINGHTITRKVTAVNNSGVNDPGGVRPSSIDELWITLESFDFDFEIDFNYTGYIDFTNIFQ